MKAESVVVCGSGIVGLACAVGLTRAGIKTGLVGPRQVFGPVDSNDYYPRVYAISSSSQRFLDELGVWSMMDTARITAVEAMEVHGDADGQLVLQAWQALQPALAWIVEASEIERVLQQAADVFGIPWLTEKFQRREPAAIVTDSGRRLDADLVIGADGAQSPVRVDAGIVCLSSPYGDVGLVGHLNAGQAHQQTALQWFTGDSVLALLPLPDTVDGPQVSMVWSMPRAQADHWLGLAEAERSAELEKGLWQATGGRLGPLQLRSRLFGFPLFLDKSDMIAAGVALVGDAAHRIHPLAGQGLNLGLADVQALIKVLADKEPYRSVADLRVLRRYRRARADSLLKMRLATDGLYRLFAAQAAPVAWARNLGMRGVDRLPFIKQHLIAAASGD